MTVIDRLNSSLTKTKERIQEWITKRSLWTLVLIEILTRATDWSSAYIVYRINPEWFLQHEQSNFAISAYYYGQWKYLFADWAMIFFLISICVLTYRYSFPFFLDKFFLSASIVKTIGAITTNLTGLVEVLTPPLPNNVWLISSLIYLSAVYFGLYILILGIEQKILLNSKKSK